MNRRIQDQLVFCDMDNTLLTAKGGVPECNRTVIRLFTTMGGRFTVATGRPPESVRAALGDIRLSAPAITCNGALIYDFSTNKVLHKTPLERIQATLAVQDILKNFPHMGVEVMAGTGEMYVVHANAYTQAHQVDEKLSSVACPLECVPDGWLKVNFAADPASIKKLNAYVQRKFYGQDNYFLLTNSIYLEIMSRTAGKAGALRDVCALTGVMPSNTTVIGDYFNDIELMKAAGYSVAVANAADEVKMTANETTVCECKDGAVGEYLYKLIGNCTTE